MLCLIYDYLLLHYYDGMGMERVIFPHPGLSTITLLRWYGHGACHIPTSRIGNWCYSQSDIILIPQLISDTSIKSDNGPSTNYSKLKRQYPHQHFNKQCLFESYFHSK